VLPSKDVRESIDFYTRLGFTLAVQDSPGERGEPGYAGLRRDAAEIHVQWHAAAEWQTVERPSLRFVLENVEELFQEYQGKGVLHENTALRTTPWGTREFAFFDPHQNGLTFYCDLE
jgi:catechol 2,3-dioxygenase-like lactoylglutathione lyase family enzyme